MADKVEMNTNPEVILRKRKNADSVRIRKTEAAKRRALDRKKNGQAKRNGKFLRAETLIARHRASEREEYRVKRVSEYDHLTLKEGENNDGESKLVFVVRVKGPYGARIPPQAFKVLRILRLEKLNMGTFVKYNDTVRPLLRLINPYIVIGTPSLATVRNLIQKRATVKVSGGEEEEEEEASVPLNDNNLIESKLGDQGIICTEDIIHEIATLGDNFKTCIKFMEPFRLNPPVGGWGPLNKLKRLELREERESHKVNNSARAVLEEVDIDKFIEQQV
ncbi:DEKNAAC105204 [Brettanomyces naardenensis]|uniref:DEKNAAC105204 n=1 Tax=Brettanomyces naardenensis TaxID=13370 RepID=A0A448YSK7_BRENA|nr:DEKNAAC105204 [Brettanomyces naardenensis]